MFTRSRNTGPNQNYPANRGQPMNPNQFHSGNNSYNQQGKYQQNIAFKSGGISMNEPFKPATTMSPQQPLQQQQQSQQQENNAGPNQQANQPPRLKPILKPSAPVTPQNNPVPTTTPMIQSTVPASAPSSVKSDDVDKDEEMPMETKELPRWKRPKVPGSKVNRKLKRLRMNQRLRKTLMPKNAIMVLNEMKAGVQFTFPENQSVPNSLFLVHAELEGKTYIGQGLSKPLARQNAAENALKSLLLEKMTAAAMKAKIDEENESNQSVTESETDISTMEISNPNESDEIPWSSLASFALYKLFLEWQNQGTVVPIPRPGVQQPVKTKPDPKMPVEKKLPPNATTIHPVMLLNQMRPGTTYVEVNRVGNPPNTLFTLSVEIDGKHYTGEAKNKKDAKKMAAKNALQQLFNLEYPEDNDDDSKNVSEQIETNNQER
ncbi:hypothetical protein PV328_008496 [Microctonus aethiopoides]|uniref:DRBM domain-containing protein n=2 Tax=Microctonus aethiopoides TaxID=144406 RepID=A0AA39FJP8_9HYME|nr:hypothetical protein PV328_008496 [Microctonus aethiopoides]